MKTGGSERLRSIPRSWRIHALAIAGYTLLALALTWPLATSFASHVPGNGVDDPPLTWNLWWVRYALLDLGTNPFDGELLFYPLGINLAFYTLTALNGLLSIPLQATLGLIPASNLLLLSSFILGGYGAFLLAFYCLEAACKQQVARQSSNAWAVWLATFAAGLLYAFASSKLAYASLGQWNIASSQWIPFYVLYLFRTGDCPWHWRYPLMVALFLLLQAYAELTYATFLVLFTTLWAIWHLLANRRVTEPSERWRLLSDLLLVGLVFTVGLAPVLAMMIPDMLMEGDIFVEGGGFSDVFSADIVGFLVPTMYHPLFGSLVERFSFDYSVGQHIYLGYSVVGLAMLGIVSWWRRSRISPAPADQGLSGGRRHLGATGANSRHRPLAYWIKFWSLLALVFWLLTLGPTLRINGHGTSITLPFAWVTRLPFFRGNRYPSRYSTMLVLSLAMLVAFGLTAFLQRSERRPIALRLLASLLLVSLILFEHVSIPLPLSDMRVPAVYQTIAENLPGDSTLLDLPVAWRNGFRVTGTQHPIIMFEQYYQSVHQKQILAGNTSRNPPFKFQYFTQAPVINTLIALETGHQVDSAVIEEDRSIAADVLRFFNVQAIAVHPAESGSEVVAYVENVMPVESFYQDEDIITYWTHLPPWPERWTIEPGDRLGRLSYVEGWGVPANGVTWAQRSEARLLIPLSGTEQKMTFRAYTPAADQRLEVKVNGQTVDRIEMVAEWMDYEVLLPAQAVRPGLNEICLRFDTLYPASQVSLSPRVIGQTGVESPVSLVVQSAGQELGDFGYVYVDGKNVSPNKRGYNVVVLHPESGKVVQTAVFDTHFDQDASRALTAFLNDVSAGQIVAVAAADEASRLLTQEAVVALQGIGAAGDLRGKFRWGHAIVGVQGASPGTAMEALDWMGPVSLAVGEGATEPHVAAAFATITLAAHSGP
jgi:hypothetical protein